MSESEYKDGQGLPTRQWLEDSFMKQLGENASAASTAEELPDKSDMSSEKSVVDSKGNDSREKLLNDLFEIRDRLIDTFAVGNDQTKIGDIITDQINRISRCASLLGAPAEYFDPLDHLSGLNIPNIKHNAENVIANTKTCYQLGKVEGKEISEDSKAIIIEFSGDKDGMRYTASGTIKGNGWQGNEAIDYIYTPGSGKMSVKAFEDGKWIDKSDKYNVAWELTESSVEDDGIEPSNNASNDFDIIEE